MTISIIIPTFNEATIIVQQIEHIKIFGGQTVSEILVCDGNSTDDTVAIATVAGAHALLCVERSRAVQMNFGAQHATGEILYFVHADTKLRPEFVTDIQEAVSEGYHAGCYRYVFDSNKSILKFNAWTTRFDRIFCRGGDQTLFVSREVFMQLNGFNEYYCIMEDYDFLIRLRKKFQFKIIQKDVIVSARKYDTNSWLRVQMANIVAFAMFSINIRPRKIRSTYKKMLNYR
jgi:rSAM/selenodomain-associated transferase 2